MSDTYGIPTPGPHVHGALRTPARWLVLIETGGAATARLYDAERRLVAEFDAGVEEVVQMTAGRTPTRDAQAAAWDAALHGHSDLERRAAEVYTLDI